MTKIWTNAQAVWDTDSDPSNPGWVVKVQETIDGETTWQTYAPAPTVYHLPRTADQKRIVRETAKWEGATLR